MNRFRWLAMQIGVAVLLFAATLGALWSSTPAAVRGQEQPPVEESPRLPVPRNGWLMRLANSQTVTSPVDPPVDTPESSPITVTGELTAAVEVTPETQITAPVEVMPSADVSASAEITGSAEVTVTGTPTYYVVLPGDTLFVLANDFGTTLEAIMAANGLSNPDVLDVGQVLLVPDANGKVVDPSLLPVVTADGALTQTAIAPRKTITERMTSFAQQASITSPFYNTTWLTFYGRPNIDVMGILGEHPIEELVPLLRAQTEEYERANGDLTVKPAFHLVYGMATKATGDDNSHLAFMGETEVISYITAAESEGWGVILDVQIGALSPSIAISPALAYLKYPNVHLAIDPEFAMSHKNQTVPGNPIGFVTAEQVNEVQAVVDAYLAEQKLPGPRILLVHQFQSDMIVEPEKLDTSSYPHVALTLSVDGWGGPWGKISKYNSLVTAASPFTAFKLFYRWDEPLLLPDEALGNRPFRGSDFFIEVTPNLIIYQ